MLFRDTVGGRDQMRITDELRKWACGLNTYNRNELQVLAIADRIDAEHEKAMSEQPYTIDMVPMTDESMAEHGWIRLPKDADGEYVHIGDRVENNERVVRIVLTEGSWEPSVYVEKAPCLLEEYFCNEVSHYHEPTVEDVLREMAIDWDCAADGEDKEAVLKEYAAKFRLANDEEAQ